MVSNELIEMSWQKANKCAVKWMNGMCMKMSLHVVVTAWKGLSGRRGYSSSDTLTVEGFDLPKKIALNPNLYSKLLIKLIIERGKMNLSKIYKSYNVWDFHSEKIWITRNQICDRVGDGTRLQDPLIFEVRILNSYEYNSFFQMLARKRKHTIANFLHNQVRRCYGSPV